MRVYFATSPSLTAPLREARYLLTSYVLDPQQQLPDRCPDAEHYLFDSGAFSVWTRGVTISLDDYAAWAHELRDRLGDRCAFLNLDVIPGAPTGRPPSVRERTAAAKASARNAAALRAASLDVVEVYHWGEPLPVLEAMLDRADGRLFALGGLAGKQPPLSVKQRWCDAVFAYLRERFGWASFPLVHGLGVNPESPLCIRYPWWSIDSASWYDFARYGRDVRRDGERDPRPGLPPSRLADGRALTALPAARALFYARVIRRWQRLERDLTELWAERGVRFAEAVQA